MISLKKLIKLAKKWQKLAASHRKRISFPRSNGIVGSKSCKASSSTAEKGHCVIYSVDQKRFEIPFKYLGNVIIRELFDMAELEFGLPSSGPIMMPCDASFMEYVISLTQRHPSDDVEKALIASLATGRCFPCSNLHHNQSNQQSLICTFVASKASLFCLTTDNIL